MRHKLRSGVIPCLALCAATSGAGAASIGVNFNSGASGGAMLATDTAGVVPQTDWNNAKVVGTGTAGSNNGGTAISGTVLPTVSGANANTLYDSNGNATGVGLTWHYDGSFTSSGGNANSSSTGTADGKLMNGYFDTYTTSTTNAAGFSTISLTGLNAFDGNSGAKILVYLGAGTTNGSRNATVTDGATIYKYAIDSVGITNLPAGYVQATTPAGSTSDVSGAPQANYAQFTVSGDTATITITPGNNNSGAYGFQVVSNATTPEPASLGAAAVTCLGLLARRRR